MILTKNLAFRLLTLLLTTTVLVSCNKTRDYKDSSRATGWKLNSKEGAPKKIVNTKNRKPARSYFC